MIHFPTKYAPLLFNKSMFFKANTHYGYNVLWEHYGKLLTISNHYQQFGTKITLTLYPISYILASIFQLN